MLEILTMTAFLSKSSRNIRAGLLASFALVSGVTQAQIRGVEITEPVVLTPEQKQKVIITDQNIFLNSGVDFTFARSLGSMISSKFGAPANTKKAREAFLQTMITSFEATTATNPLSGITVNLTPRPGEASLSPAAMLSTTDQLDSMDLVGMTFRFDLMPANGENCGEARQIFAKRSELIDGNNRFFIIEEAAVPNPKPELGVKGCLPVAQFYESLATKSGPKLASALEQFFYTGGAVKGLKPIVMAANYDSDNGGGQIRENMFVNTLDSSFKWQLRQHSVVAGSATLNFKMEPVDDSPFVELYRSQGGQEDPNLIRERPNFQRRFVRHTMPALLASDMAAKKTGTQLTDSELFFNLSGPVLSRYNNFQSTSSIDDDPAGSPDMGFVSQINEAIPLGKLQYPLDATEVLNRAGTQSCGGCHEFSSVGVIVAPSQDGNSVLWPGPVDFVHIAHDTVSILLTDRFLPSRVANLDAFVASHGAMKPAEVSEGTRAAFKEVVQMKAEGKASARDVARARPGFFGPRPTH
jgi:hypothetical protein